MFKVSVTLFLFFYTATAKLQAPIQPNYDSFGKVLKSIERSFRKQYYSFTLTGTVDDSTRSLVDWILSKISTAPAMVVNGQLTETTKHPVPSSIILVSLKNVSTVNSSFDKVVKSSFFTYQSYIFFVLMKDTFNEKLLESGAYVWKNHFLNFFFVFYDGQLQVITYNPFKNDKLENYTVDNRQEMFTNKAIAMNGYPVYGGTIEDIPRAVYRNNTLYASDAVAIKGVFRYFNATIRETFLPNVSYNHINAKLEQGALDCGFMTQFLHNFTEMDAKRKIQHSYPYNSDATMLILPSPKLKPSYLNIFYIFQDTLWIFLVCTCLLITLMIALLDAVADYRYEPPIFQTLRIMVNLPSTQIKNATVSKKILFGFCIWLAFFFNIIFHSSLTSTLIKPKSYDRIRTLKELAATDRMVYMFAKPMAERSSSWEFLKHHYIYVNKSDIYDMIMAGNDQYGYSCNSMQCADILVRRSRNKHKKDLFYTLKEALVPGHRGYIFPKNSPYLSTVDYYLLLYKEFGLQHHKYGSYKIQKVLIPEPDVFASNRALARVNFSLAHMQTSFYILLLGLTVSTLVFLYEVFIDKCLKKARKLRKPVLHF